MRSSREIETVETICEVLDEAIDNYRKIGTPQALANAARCERVRNHHTNMLGELDALRQWGADSGFD